jgi:RimJ/RimL family protein N-acetyltransferase
MLTIIPLSPDTLTAALNIRCAPEQLAFVETPENIIQGKRASEDVHLILKGSTVIGLFKIDRDYRASMPLCGTDELGLRGFIVDIAEQGRGIGKQISGMLKDYLAKTYPERSSLVLTVNCKNTNAQRAYLKGGFTDTGELYLGGAAGPQHIYRKGLR